MSITWSSFTTAPDSAKQWRGCVWSAELGLYIVTGNRTVETADLDRVMTSPDGENWTLRASPEPNRWNGVCWSPSLNLLVTVGQDGFGASTNRVMTSPDGINWTLRAHAENNVWTDVCWSPSLALFCAVSSTGVNRVMTSPDGIVWTSRLHSGAGSYQRIIWAPALNLFIATTGNELTGFIMTSPDGINWTSRVTGLVAGETFYDLAYADNLPLAIIVLAHTGIFADKIITSPDGINWTHGTIPYNLAKGYKAVCFNSGPSLFCAVSAGNALDDPRIVTSPDGSIWTANTIPAELQGWLLGLVKGSETLQNFVTFIAQGGVGVNGGSGATFGLGSAIEPPVVNAGPDQNIYTSSTTLAGSVTGDDSPTALWTKISGPGAVIFVDNTDELTDVTFTVTGAYVLRLTGTNSAGSTSDDVTITIVTNTISAGNDSSALLSEGIDLVAAYVVQAIAATYLWSKKSGPGDVTFSDPTSLLCHADFTKNGKYLLKIQATNGPLITYSYIVITVLNLAALPIASEV